MREAGWISGAGGAPLDHRRSFKDRAPNRVETFWRIVSGAVRDPHAAGRSDRNCLSGGFDHPGRYALWRRMSGLGWDRATTRPGGTPCRGFPGASNDRTPMAEEAAGMAGVRPDISGDRQH